MMIRRSRFMDVRTAPLALLCLLLGACTVGPNYHRPSAPAPPAFKEEAPPDFKEAQAQGWEVSKPGDAYEKGRWWELYGDPQLNALERQVSVSNQNVQQAEATFREAKALVAAARAGLFPTVGTSPGVTAQGGGRNSAQAVGSNGSSAGSSSKVATFFSLPFSASWEPDLWGNIRRGIAEAAAGAQASAGDLENAKLLYQSELAEDYFGLRGNQAEAALLQQTQDSYQQYLELTTARLNAGIVTELDVDQAQAQLFAVESELIDLGVARSQYEHAIAVLIGKAPAELSIGPGQIPAAPPAVPVGVPSELLERRPDIAAAERRVAAANEQIGIAIAAFYPQLTLSGLLGLDSSSLTKWFSWPARVWSVGPQLAETLFDAGRREAVVAEDRAAYDATVAAYRQTVLTAFQQVEDNLAALRILESESAKQQETIQAASRSLSVAGAQYRAGTADYLTVISSQASLLNAQVTSVTLLTRRMTASVMLIQALGGGWKSSELPTATAVSSIQK